VEYFLASIPPMFIVACHKSEATVQPKRGKKRRAEGRREPKAA